MKKILKTMAVTAITAGALMSANVYAGAEAKCKACHDFGTKNMVGPGLAGIMGKQAGSSDFGNYSKSLKNGGWTWDEANMRKWLADSKAAIKELTGDANAKTTMPAQKLTDAQVDEVIKFLSGI